MGDTQFLFFNTDQLPAIFLYAAIEKREGIGNILIQNHLADVMK